MIGAYGSRNAAESAVARLGTLPGFVDHPEVIDAGEGLTSGFYISELTLGDDHWTEGYVTV